MTYTYEYPRPMLTVDVVVFLMLQGQAAKILLIRRGNEPFKNMWALPGGFVDMDEGLKDAAGRELEEETGLKDVPLKQMYAFDALDRDPRGRNISVVFYAILTQEAEIAGGDDAAEAVWWPVNAMPQLGFDHDEVIEMAKEKIRHYSKRP